jgi:two-component system sensor histidine kinase MprB
VTLRRRFALVAAVAVAVTIVLASVIVYVVVRGELRGRVDDELRQAAGRRVPLGVVLREGVGGGGPLDPGGVGAGGAGAPGGPGVLPPPRDALGLPTAYLAIVDSGGTVIVPAGGAPRLPVTAGTRAVAAGSRPAFLSDARVAGQPVRVLTRPLSRVPGFALQIARPLTEVDRTLHRLAFVLLLVSGGGIALAAALGRFAARTALAPVAQLTETVEHVAQTTDLTRRIALDAAHEDDELARLARSFNVMLAALESSVGRQRQLVADASHELRTPLTSLRTNIELLARAEGGSASGNGAAPPTHGRSPGGNGAAPHARAQPAAKDGAAPHAHAQPAAGDGAAPPRLSAGERRRLLDDVVEQLDELGGLVGDVVELAREQEPAAESEDVRFDELVGAALARARRRPGAPAFAAELEPCLVRGVPARLDRAVANLLDNAAKWSPSGGVVEVALRSGELTVRDHGPGIAASDLPRVFERFYRAPSARGMPGSGLGLAIVRQVAELHGGRVEARAAPGGGALLRLSLPAEQLPAPGDVGPSPVLMVDT